MLLPECLNVTILLLDAFHDLEFGRSMKIITSTFQQLDQVLSHISTAEVITLGRILDTVTLIDSTGTTHTITHIQNHASHHASSVETQHRRRLEEYTRHTKSIEHQVSSLDTVVQRIQRVLCQ
jgi:uncharacterized damage-inducible protein DinB